MKEFFATGAAIMALAWAGTSPLGTGGETNCPDPVKTRNPEGFVPRQQVTMPPIREATVPDEPFPDFGSEAYL